MHSSFRPLYIPSTSSISQAALLSKIKDTGFKYSIAIAFNRVIPQWLFRIRRFNVYELPPVARISDHPNPARIAENEHEVHLAELLSGCLRADSDGSCEVAIIQQEEQVIAALWTSAEQFYESELGLQLKLSDCQRWLFSAYVDRPYRHQGHYRELLNFVTTVTTTSLAGQGALSDSSSQDPNRVFLLAINPDNRRSMAAHRSVGAKPVARVTAWRILRFARVSTKSMSPDWEAIVERNSTNDCLKKPTVVRFRLVEKQRSGKSLVCVQTSPEG